MKGRKPQDPADRFWAKVGKDGPLPLDRPELGPCWLWTASLHESGYGTFSTKNSSGHWQTISAHRWAFIDAGGVVEPHQEIDHLCRNRACVNHAHLQAITHAQNIANRKPRNIARFGRYQRSDGNKKSVTIILPENLNQRVRAVAADLDCSVSFVVAAALTQFFALSQSDERVAS